MSRVFLIHGWGGRPKQHWFPWITKELKRAGHTVIEPAMPNTNVPEMHAWVGHVMQVIGVPRKDDILVGHSIGCLTIIHYLSLLSRSEKVGKVILVAPFVRLKGLSKEEKPIAHPWLTTPIKWKEAKAHASEFTCIFSTNDPYVYVSDKKTFEKKLNAKTIVEKNKGHFTNENKIDKLPSLKKEIVG